MPTISVDCLLVIVIQVAANVVAMAKVLEQIWAPRRSFWLFITGGFAWSLASMVAMWGSWMVVIQEEEEEQQQQSEKREEGQEKKL